MSELEQPEDEHAPEPVAWWEWPIVVVITPFVTVWRALRRLVEAVTQAIAGAFAAVGRALWRPVKALGRALWWPVRKLGQAIGRGIGALGRLIRAPFHAIARALRRLVHGIARALGVPVRAVWAALRWGAHRAWEALLWAVAPPLAAAWHAIRQAWRAITLLGPLLQRLARALVAPLTALGRGLRWLVEHVIVPILTPIVWFVRWLGRLFEASARLLRAIGDLLARPFRIAKRAYERAMAPVRRARVRLSSLGERVLSKFSRL